MAVTEVATSDQITLEELALAARNHGMPLEALRYDLTPVGLHYLLIHFDIPQVDERSWTLTLDGAVRREVTIDLEDLQARPAVTVPVTLECAGNGRARLSPRPISQPWLNEAVSTAEWTGTPLRPLLEEAGVVDEAVEVLFTGWDHGIQGGVEQDYQRSLPLEEAMRPEVLLAYGMNGGPLLPQHGFPVRVIVPGWYGMTHVKWLRTVTVLAQPFNGYQQLESYRLTRTEDDPGEPVTLIRPKALMVPPGVPDFLSRTRYVDRSPCLLEGRAWSGWAPISRVEVSTDGGRNWQEAALEEPPSLFSWARWTFSWEPAETGEYELCCRAWDAAGNSQPLEQPWNLQGMANNHIQRVRVVVQPPS